MSIKRYIANKDTTITNAYKINNVSRAIDSNMGASDVLEVFSIYGQITTSSLEKSRILIQFPSNDILADRNNKLVGQSGSVEFILKLSNANQPDSAPDNLNLVVSPLSRSWQEGVGLDMEGYNDYGYANWVSASDSQAWTTEGGDIISSEEIQKTLNLSTEDLELDVTEIVEKWLNGSLENNGLLVNLTSSQEDSTESFYTKKFFARRSQFFFKRPWIEARTADSVKDKRNSFYSSSPLVDSSENLNTIFIYNRVRGNLKNIPTVGTGTLLVKLYSGSATSGPLGVPQVLQGGVTQVTGGFYSTGIYTASVGITSSLQYLYDVWSLPSNTQIITGSVINVLQHSASFDIDVSNYVLAMPELKNKYLYNENVRMRVYAYNKEWDSNIYTVSSKDNPVEIIENLYYKVTRIADDYTVIDYGTGSYQHTLCSYDQVSNYFDLSMDLFERGYSYRIEFLNKDTEKFDQFEENFKFRVE